VKIDRAQKSACIGGDDFIWPGNWGTSNRFFCRTTVNRRYIIVHILLWLTERKEISGINLRFVIYFTRYIPDILRNLAGRSREPTANFRDVSDNWNRDWPILLTQRLNFVF
jgi:hypothetical protein